MGNSWVIPIGNSWVIPIGNSWVFPMGNSWVIPIGNSWVIPIGNSWVIPLGVHKLQIVRCPRSYCQILFGYFMGEKLPKMAAFAYKILKYPKKTKFGESKL